MQQIYERIYEMATEEVPFSIFDFWNETAVIYKGFKISKSKTGEYSWKDVRFDDYYEMVDPIITEKILELGFSKTLTMVMIHNDHDKVAEIKRKIINIDSEIEHWVTKSTNLYGNYKKSLNKINRSSTLSKETKKKRRSALLKRYDKDKILYEKKRRVLKEDKDNLRIDFTFYENRIRSFNNN